MVENFSQVYPQGDSQQIKKEVRKIFTSKLVNISNLSPLVPLKPFKKELNKSKYYSNKSNKLTNIANNRNRWTYTQASSPSVKEVLKIKENFLKLSSQKIKNIYKMINKLSKTKLYINMTTKGPFWRQIIVPISNGNIFRFISFSSDHIININRNLKNIKSDIMTNFICSDHCSLIITTNKVVSTSNLTTIKSYIKKFNNIESSNIMSPWLPQSKFYLKIIGISYLMEFLLTPAYRNLLSKISISSTI